MSGDRGSVFDSDLFMVASMVGAFILGSALVTGVIVGVLALIVWALGATVPLVVVGFVVTLIAMAVSALILAVFS